ncbi:hypothetical protein K7X08_025865 [Anisodus acutangulus]|uniref:beta-galactosidase n=1 Tax=Anisodus acutangulus TaxID=402998 RepID=A0A9Q1LC25_9SOLA|nr:hypothetical protein K7X08_025865 [Anisodus acutangulus]
MEMSWWLWRSGLVAAALLVVMAVVPVYAGGANVTYDGSGRRDIVAFMKQIQAQGLYACPRIGPYIEGEWTYGGFPFWLHDVPAIVFRSNNEPFKYHGGTNFGRSAAEYMITSYYDQAPLDEYGKHTIQYKNSNTSRLSLTQLRNGNKFEEVIPQFDATSLRSDVLLEHMNTTKDVSDYLCIQQDSMEQQSTISVKTLGHVLHSFVNGEHVGSAHGRFRDTSFTLESTVSLNKGTNNIALLSETVGLPDSGSFVERRALGVNLHQYKTFSKVGLSGEKLQIYSLEGSKSANWSSLGSSQPLTWYKSVFDAPKGDDPVALNLGSMEKGEVWVNGQSIGRYWVSFRTLAGIPSQTWYNVPRSFLQPGDNLLVLFEEETGNPLDITVDTISVTKTSSRK